MGRRRTNASRWREKCTKVRTCVRLMRGDEMYAYHISQRTSERAKDIVHSSLELNRIRVAATLLVHACERARDGSCMGQLSPSKHATTVTTWAKER